MPRSALCKPETHESLILLLIFRNCLHFQKADGVSSGLRAGERCCLSSGTKAERANSSSLQLFALFS